MPICGLLNQLVYVGFCSLWVNSVMLRCYWCSVRPPAMELRRVCGLQCPGLEGQFPSMSCIVCKSMFHPACVGLTPTATEFTCKVSVNFVSFLVDLCPVHAVLNHHRHHRRHHHHPQISWWHKSQTKLHGHSDLFTQVTDLFNRQ